MSTLSGFTDQGDRTGDERAEQELVPRVLLLSAVNSSACLD